MEIIFANFYCMICTTYKWRIDMWKIKIEKIKTEKTEKREKMDIGKVLLIEMLVIIVGLMYTVMVTGGANDIVMLIDMPSLFLIILFCVPVLIISGLWKDFVKAFSVSKQKYSIAQLRRCLEAVLVTQKLVLISSFFTAFISIITLLKKLVEPEVLGPNLAVVCLSGLYAVIVEFLLLPLKTNVQVTLIHEMEISNEEDETETGNEEK